MSQSVESTDLTTVATGVERFLRATVDEAMTVNNLTRLSGGAVQENFGAEIILADGDHHSVVVRTDAVSQVSASLSRAEEFNVLQVAFEGGVTVPQPMWCCEDTDFIGRPFYIMQRAPGTAAAHQLVRDDALVPDRRQLLLRLGEELAKIHAVSPFAPELASLPSAGDSPALHRIAEYRGFLDDLGAAEPALEWALGCLTRHAPPAGPLAFCHGDFRTGNFMVHDGDVSAILDWEFASFSDPMEDLGWFCARCWRFGQWDRPAGGLGSREVLFEGYERTSGVAVDPRVVRYWELMATVRWAVIALQQGARYSAGGEASLELVLTGYMVPEMCLDALLLADELDGISG